jgi:hypothetical protein
MKCPKEIRLCPELWSDCDLCKYNSLDNTCLYPKSDLGILILAAKIAERVVTKDAKKSAERIMLNWADWYDHERQINLLSEDEKWLYRFGNPNPHLHAVEPYKAMSGPSAPGGSSVKCKKSNKGAIPTVYVWGSTD